MIDGDLFYVGDRENARIQIFDRYDRFLRQWKLGSPFGLALARDHSLYMADAIAGRILKIDPEGKVVGSFAGPQPGQGPHFDPHELNERIQEYDRRIEKMAKERYPETALLKQVKGVGDLIALTYVLTIEDPHRFRKSRDAGCFVGLQPSRRNSGESEPQMHQQTRGRVSAEAAGAGSSLHSGTLWGR